MAEQISQRGKLEFEAQLDFKLSQKSIVRHFKFTSSLDAKSQTIKPNGTKRFVKDGAKQELFQVVCSRKPNELATTPLIVIGED
jgi:phage/plasmid primase-like uncharacterized protein